jgi:transcriptional regulator with XRE-family HTH domain
MTQAKIASSIGITQSCIAKYKLGLITPSLTTARLLAQEYGCSIDYLAQCLDEHRLPDKPKPAPLCAH